MDKNEGSIQKGGEEIDVVEHVPHENPSEAIKEKHVMDQPVKEKVPVLEQSQSCTESVGNNPDPLVTSGETHQPQDSEHSTSDPSLKPFLKPSVVPFKLPVLPLRKTQKLQSSEVTNVKKTRKDIDGSSPQNQSKHLDTNSRSSDFVTDVEGDVSKDNSAEKAEISSDPEGHVTKKRKRQEPSPAEKLNIPPLPYKSPSWGGIPDKKYSLEVLKGGKILDTISLNEKSFHVFGRLATCDVTLEHPSISRYHLVIQYRAVGDSERDPGFYLYDLASTHGSQVNKGSMKSQVYYRIRVGHQFKLGGSTRIFILQGPPEDEEAESELSVTQLKELRRKQLEEQEELKRKQEEEDEMETEEETKKEEGVCWGMRDDAEEEIDMEKNPFNVMSQAEKEASYMKDPKKTLRGYFEREGVELEYDVEEKGSGFNKQYVCKVELPIDDAEGEPITAEAAVSGKKKEAVLACALEACRILDAHGVLRQAVHESKQKKKKNWAEDDYYDSDDDSYLDRTGIIEKKRNQRMVKAGVIKQEVDTYGSLLVKLSKVNEELESTQKELDILKQEQNTGMEEDTLDAFINQLKSGKAMDKTKRAKMKLRTIELRKEQTRLQKLIKLVQPASVTFTSGKEKSQSTFAALSQKLPMKGFMKGRKIPQKKTKTEITQPDSTTTTTTDVSISSTNKMEEVEEEEDEEEEEEKEEATHDNKDEAHKGGEISGTDKVTLSNTSNKIEQSKDDMQTIDVPASNKLGEKNKSPVEESKTEAIHRARSPKVVSPSLQRRPKRVLGPQMGPIIKFKEFMNRDETESSTSSQGDDAKKKKVEGKFSDWIPPDDQKGDGRTFLNEKYGY